MKKQITSTAALIIMAIILGAAQLAQASTSARLVVHVPFDFVAGQQQLPAGSYTVRRVRTDSETAFVIQSGDGKQAATLLTHTAGESSKQAKLVFRQYGDRLFLASVWVPGTAGGREVNESKQERRLRRELRARAETGGAAKIVTVLGSVQ